MNISDLKVFTKKLQSFLQLFSHGPALYPTSIANHRFLVCYIIILIVLRLWIVEVIDLIATAATYDEELFVNLAKHILDGNWLGPYNQLTLVKGPGYPLFIAIAHHTGIPLITAEQLLYSLVCVLVVFALRPLFKAQWPLAIIFTIILFNPFMHSYSALGRVFRLGIYMPLSLCIFGLFIGLLVRAGSSFPKRLFWSALLGVCFTYAWYTREEGVWLLPSFTLFSLYFIVIYSDFTWKETIKRGSCLFLIGLIFGASTYALTALNNKHYGAPVINELKTPEFGTAYGTLLNIDGLGSGRDFPVSPKSQAAASEVSPAFAKLETRLQGHTQPYKIPPAYYIWLLRDVAYASGHADTLPKSLEYYSVIGKELQAACRNGKLDCLKRPPTIKPVWKSEYFSLVPGIFWDTWLQAVTFRHYTDDKDAYLKWNTTADSDSVMTYETVTREKAVPGHKHHFHKLPQFHLTMKKEKLRILGDIATGYQVVVPILFVFSLVAHIILISRSAAARMISFEVMSGFLVLGGILSLILILTYARTTSDTWAINRAIFPAYPLVLLYISLMISFLWKELTEQKKYIS